ncbi:MAG TPA: FAD-dependent oxidoreductase, partial [Vicinamibacteria bacterium]|nr:FAD-dependent oxidoreductase [Vicinamibacteria bacterium]
MSKRADFADYERATFATANRVLAVVRPRDRGEVQACMRVAQEWRVPVYPVSGGKNWGLGSRVPSKDGCAILDLGRLNRILDFNEELSYMTVQPGVSFAQVSEYLRVRGSQHYLCVTGGPPEGSLIGNALERGDGLGPYGERSLHCCAFEV